VKEEANRTNLDSELSIVHLLNILDVVMESENPKPSAQVANAVYRGLINQEKRKTYDSIATLNNEISQLQGKLEFLNSHL
jgi:hypothetical protein